MRKFRVLINGQNLNLDMDGKVSKHGFYTLRFVEAIDEVLAESTALENLKAEKKIQELSETLLNVSEDPPRFQVEEVVEVDSFDNIENLEPGLGLYPENEEES